MKIQVKGLKTAQEALDRELRKVKVASEEMVAVILMGISASTKPYVPVDTGTLINSEARWTQEYRGGIRGYIHYGAHGGAPRGTPVQEYAIYVHEGPQKNWQKPGASNRYLAKGVMDFVRDDLPTIIERYSAK